MHARGCEAGGGAELSSGRMGVVRRAWRKGRGHAAGKEGAGHGVTGGGVGLAAGKRWGPRKKEAGTIEGGRVKGVGLTEGLERGGAIGNMGRAR